jgi:nucleoside-diphosphate-sugar epimerase
MKILIYGSAGWIGSQFIAMLQDENVVIGEARMDDIERVKIEIEDHEPTHVVSFIGRTHGKIDDRVFNTIDYLEQPDKLVENVRDNLFAPIAMAKLASEYGFHYTYLGTGCIFEYDEDHPFGREDTGFDETDLPNFFGSSYSVVKGYTDRLMHMFNADVLNVRIRMPITGDMNSRNFITKIVNYDRICSVPNSMTVLPELLPVLLKMMMEEQTGTVNLCNPGLITHNEILEMYRDTVDPDFTWKNFTVDEQRAILAAGRSNNCLDTTIMEIDYGVKSIRDSVQDMMYKIKSQKDHI